MRNFVNLTYPTQTCLYYYVWNCYLTHSFAAETFSLPAYLLIIIIWFRDRFSKTHTIIFVFVILRDTAIEDYECGSLPIRNHFCSYTCIVEQSSLVMVLVRFILYQLSYFNSDYFLTMIGMRCILCSETFSGISRVLYCLMPFSKVWTFLTHLATLLPPPIRLIWTLPITIQFNFIWYAPNKWYNQFKTYNTIQV